MNIYLIGYMGSGKSALGRELALKLNYNFIDLDQMIELKQNQTINSIFEKQGEVYFRGIETDALHKTKKFNKVVVACGGGTPCFSNNMQWMNDHGLTIYLKVSLGKLFHRLALSKKDRPIIKDKPDLELMEFMIEDLDKRESYYSKAKLTFEDDELSSEKLYKLLKTENVYSK